MIRPVVYRDLCPTVTADFAVSMRLKYSPEVKRDTDWAIDLAMLFMLLCDVAELEIPESSVQAQVMFLEVFKLLGLMTPEGADRFRKERMAGWLQD